MARNFSSGNLDGGDLSFLDSLSKFSWHIWVYIDSDDNADMIIWEKSPSGFTDGLTMFLDDVGPNANNTFELFHTGTDRMEPNAANLNAANWQSIGGHVEWGVSSGSKLYIDGALVATATFNSYVNNAEPFLLGMHNNSGDRRYLNGSLAYLTFWDEILIAQDFTDLSNGKGAATIEQSLIIRHWDIAGDTSPEPESIDGTDTLTVTNATQVSDPTLTAAALSLAVEEAIADTTAELSCTSDQKGGALHCYVSTSATAPSAADLKAGTGAVFKTSTITSPSEFPFSSELIADADNGDTGIGAIQGIETDDTWFFVSYSDRIYTYNSSWVYQSDIDVTGVNSGLHTQVNGMFVIGSDVYVTANEFPTTTSSWVYKFAINAGTGALTFTSTTTLSAGGVAEAPAFDGTEWWVCSHDKHGVDRYNSSWGHQEYHAFPGGTDPGTSKWQGLVWFDNFLVVNVHDENTNAPRVDIYEFDGADFSTYNTELVTPQDAGQGFIIDGSNLLWAQRDSLTIGNIVESTILYEPIASKNKFYATGLSAGTTYYSYFLHDTGVGNGTDSNILESGSWVTTGGAAVSIPVAMNHFRNQGIA